ncbi:hypothetical protein LNO36_25495 [Klebsiella variicola subsp. variicola]|nr:hypothetical protein [Klebsiella variicola subsp. variicola]
MAMVNENIVIRLAQDVDIPEVKQLLERYHAKILQASSGRMDLSPPI